MEIVKHALDRASDKTLDTKSFLYARYGIDARSAAFPILKRLAYHIPNKVIPLLWKCLSIESVKVAKEAAETLKSVVEYDIELLPHLGLRVQSEMCAYLSSLPPEELVQHSDTTLALCSKILSLEMQGTRLASADTFVFSRGTLPASEELRALRKNTFLLLKNLYGIVSSAALKRRIMGTLYSITRHPRGNEKISKDTLTQINSEVNALLDFYEQIIPTADNESLQKIGHDIYWMHYHHAAEYSDDTIYKILAVRDKLYANEELNIFNVLVGFESVFPYEWVSKDSAEDSVKQEKEYRERKAAEYLEQMDATNYPEWEKRILDYAQIESNDLATFMYFGKFVVAVGIKHPRFAKALLLNNSEKLQGFRAALLEGLLESDSSAANAIITEWFDKGLYLPSLCNVLERTRVITLDQYAKLLAYASELKDQIILNLLVGALAERYSDTEDTTPLIIATIRELTKYKDTRWVNVYWWRKKLGSIAKHLGADDADVILDNLLNAPSIETHEEWVLAPIAKEQA